MNTATIITPSAIPTKYNALNSVSSGNFHIQRLPLMLRQSLLKKDVKEMMYICNQFVEFFFAAKTEAEQKYGKSTCVNLYNRFYEIITKCIPFYDVVTYLQVHQRLRAFEATLAKDHAVDLVKIYECCAILCRPEVTFSIEAIHRVQSFDDAADSEYKYMTGETHREWLMDLAMAFLNNNERDVFRIALSMEQVQSYRLKKNKGTIHLTKDDPVMDVFVLLTESPAAKQNESILNTLTFLQMDFVNRREYRCFTLVNALSLVLYSQKIPSLAVTGAVMNVTVPVLEPGYAIAPFEHCFKRPYKQEKVQMDWTIFDSADSSSSSSAKKVAEDDGDVDDDDEDDDDDDDEDAMDESD